MIRKLNLLLLIVPVLLFSLGFVTLLSTSSFLTKSHLVFFLLGLVVYFVTVSLDFSYLKYFSFYIYVLAVVFLLITFIFAELRFGAARWIQIGPVNFQTSEYAKIAVIIMLSAFISERMEKINEWKTLLLSGLMFLPVFGFVLIQPDLGTSIVLFSAFTGILFFAGVSKYYFVIMLFIAGIFSTPLWHFLKDYQKKRILVFLNPQLDILGSGYNVIQSVIAVGSGGLLGKGFGRGTQANLQFLPAHWTDFIFASFAEEWGFLGVFTLVTLFAILLFTVLYTVFKTKDLFGRLVCIGVFLVLFVQFTVNVGMNLGIMPVTGVTLPLISYGGSSMLFTMLALGIVQNVWVRDVKK